MARPEGGISVTSHQSLALLIPAFKLQGTPHERTLFS